MIKVFTQLQKLVHQNVHTNPIITDRETEVVGEYYIGEIKKEADEVFAEIKQNNAVYLTDELADIFWDYSTLLEMLASRGYIDSVDAVYERVLAKYQERSEAFADNDNSNWNQLKEKQKTELAQQHRQRYNT